MSTGHTAKLSPETGRVKDLKFQALERSAGAGQTAGGALAGVLPGDLCWRPRGGPRTLSRTPRPPGAEDGCVAVAWMGVWPGEGPCRMRGGRCVTLHRPDQIWLPSHSSALGVRISCGHHRRGVRGMVNARSVYLPRRLCPRYFRATCRHSGQTEAHL